MVGPNGLEPLTSTVSRWRSSQLSYGPTDWTNLSIRAERRRTPGLLLVFDDLSALHYERNVFEEMYIRQRVTLDRNDVRVLSSFQGANTIGPAEQVRRVHRASLNRLQRGQTHLHHLSEFVSVQSMRIDGRVGAQGNFHAGFESMREILLRDGQNQFGFLDHVGSEPQHLHVFHQPIFQIHGGNQIGSALLHQCNILIIYIAAVSD